ncbi:MAG TPA: hypothetical protein VFE16_04380 [Candidatus Cybelea sp.]|nr:hypothetical protein [Candidatus Cybelea sp.]
MRVGFRTIVSLALCAAAAAAAIAHVAIDVVGDFALARDSYDNLGHSSRELMSGIALIIATWLAVRGLRICCEIAAKHRASLLRPALRLRETLGLFAGAVAASVAIVPAMEYLDGRLDGVRVGGLNDAFGGSMLLGLATTLVCATVVTAFVYAFARWLIAHRDSVADLIETLLRRPQVAVAPHEYDLIAQRVTPRRRPLHALRLAKRGPPGTCFA